LELFNELDLTHDGRLDVDELHDAMKKIRYAYL